MVEILAVADVDLGDYRGVAELLLRSRFTPQAVSACSDAAIDRARTRRVYDAMGDRS